MDEGEQIRAHIVSVWRETDRRIVVGGREGMLFLTDKHLMFVHKTESKLRWWQAVVQRQTLTLFKSKDPMIRHDGYGETDLARDLENKKNEEIQLSSILKATHEEKAWGSVLYLTYEYNGKTQKRRFSIVRDWVKYPAKDPARYMRIDWEPVVSFIKEHQTSSSVSRVTAYAIGVGPGAPEYITQSAADAIRGCNVIVGYNDALRTIDALLKGKDVRRVTMGDQERIYQELATGESGLKIAVVFTGDANFSESEVVDRLGEIFGSVTIVPGISSIQVAAAKSHIPLDRCRVISMHITSSIERKKIELKKALLDGQSVILVPRPWPKRPDLEFMPSDVAQYLRDGGLPTGSMRVRVYEDLTLTGERVFEGNVDELSGKEFSGHLVMVFEQHDADSYMNYRWQWAQPSGLSSKTDTMSS